MIANLSSTIARFATGTYVVRRRSGAGSYSSSTGVFTPASDQTLQVPACVQPASGKDLQRLEEGQRLRDVRAIFSSTELRTATSPGGTPADRIVIDGKEFEIFHVEPFNELGGYWKALAQRSDTP